MFSAFNPSKCTHLEQWAADCAAPGEQSWTCCWSRESNPQPWVTSGFKSNALSTRPCLNPLGHGVHHDDIMELVNVRDLALLHLLFEDAPQITFTLSFSWLYSKVIMLEYCPAAQSLKGGDHALLQYVTVHVGIHGSLI